MAKQRVNFDLNHLNDLVAADNSCVALQSAYNFLLNVTPIHLTNIKESVKELLDERTTTYDPDLDGIILSYKNVKIKDSLQLADNGNFMLQCYADVFVFRPSVGSTLKGIVSKKGQNHLGCLVHSAFNVSLLKEDCSDKKYWPGARIDIGQEVTFTVIKLDFTGRLPYIRGRLMDSRILDDNAEEVDSGIGHFESVGEEETKDSFLEKKKKKKLKKEKREPDDDIEITSCYQSLNSPVKLVSLNLEDASDGIHSPKKKCKKRKFSDVEGEADRPKKKLKHINEISSSTILLPDAVEEEEASIKKVKKKKKHRKHSPSPSLNDGGISPVKVVTEKLESDNDIITKLMENRVLEMSRDLTLSEITPTKKSHKKKKKETSVSLQVESDSTEVTGVISSAIPIEEAQVSEKVRKKKKKKDHDSTEAPDKKGDPDNILSSHSITHSACEDKQLVEHLKKSHDAEVNLLEKKKKKKKKEKKEAKTDINNGLRDIQSALIAEALARLT